MHLPKTAIWRWARAIWLAAAWGLALGAPTVHGQKDMGAGYCGLHGNYTGPSCPQCASGSGGSGSSAQDQLLLDAAGILGSALGEMLRGDPQRAADLAAEARERALALQRAAAEREREAQENFVRIRGMLKLETFDGDGGALVLKGVDPSGGMGLKLASPDAGGPGLKLGDGDLKPLGTRAHVNTGAGNAAGGRDSAPNTDPGVVDLRNFQRASYVATLPGATDEAIVAAALGDISIIGIPPPDAVPVLAGPGLMEFQLVNEAYRRSHDDGMKAAEHFTRAQAQREIAGRELRQMRADLERELAQTADSATLAGKHEQMARIFAVARAEDEAWVSAKAELDATRAREAFDRATLVRAITQLRVGAGAAVFPDSVSTSPDTAGTTARSRRLEAMNALAQDLGWTEEERDRLEKAFDTLVVEGFETAHGEVLGAWNDVRLRAGAELAAKAVAYGGPGLPGAGTQADDNKDCIIFALANAAGLPYGLVAGRAAGLLRHATWRPAGDRANPQDVIESQGLNGDELIMLAESFGQAEVVPSARFTEVLSKGHPVLVALETTDGKLKSAHQAVLTKTFVHEETTWFEMMDSSEGPLRWLYLNSNELEILLLENGVAFRPEERTVPLLLRSPGEN